MSHYSIQQLFQLSHSQLKQLNLKAQQIDAFLHPDQKHIDLCLNWKDSAPDRDIITYQDARYPERLKQISSAPLLLYVEGNSELLSSNQLAIVGSRNCTPYGQDKAFQFAQQLSLCGLTITSGLALGIDAMAHQGALSGSANTIAVLGTGLNNIYPKRHQKLAAEIREKGLLISEFWPDTAAFPSNFPRRNRIISGLSLGTLVIEASIRSGSLITARYANEQNREVFALPGSVDNSHACGCLKLIQEGAKLVINEQDILDEFSDFVFPQTTQTESKTDAKAQHFLLTMMDDHLTSFETILARSGMDVVELQNELIELEINGTITAQPQGYLKIKG